jgi:solute carrier family 45 protein 1/2/4
MSNRPLSSPRPRGILKNASYNRDSYDARPSASLDTQKEQEDQDETSPLIAPRRESQESALTISSMPSPEDSDPWNNITTEETKSQWYLILLTLSIGGLQIAWSVELSNGSVSPTLLIATLRD